MNMKDLGLDDRLLAESALYPGRTIGRVASQYKDRYKLIDEQGELLGAVSGKFRFTAKTLSDYPAVGDFVMFERDGGNAVIHAVLTRKSVFLRRAAGTSGDEQVVASNIDTVFLCMSLNKDFNLRRLERYLSIAWDSGATPVVVLTKADLCGDLERRLADVDAVALGAHRIVTSAMSGDGFAGVMGYCKAGHTIALIGSSGVGKSTLINRLLGEDLLDTKGLRNDDKGRHTTTRRELIVLPGGAMVIDTPGMRELGIESADVAKAFADIDALAAGCRFRDCTHMAEPGCAVRDAMDRGEIPADRFLSYQKLKIEASYEGLNAKQIESEKLNRLMSEIGGMKNARRLLKEKDKRKF